MEELWINYDAKLPQLEIGVKSKQPGTDNSLNSWKGLRSYFVSYFESWNLKSLLRSNF